MRVSMSPGKPTSGGAWPLSLPDSSATSTWPRRALCGPTSGTAPAWRGNPGATSEPLLEFSRFASVEGHGHARRLAYRLNDQQEIELWLWPGLDIPSDAEPARYPVLADVTAFELQYLNANLAWMDGMAWLETRCTDSPSRAAAHRARLG